MEMIWEWNGGEWTRYNETWRCEENFEWQHGYVRKNTWKVIKDLILWTSDGMDDSLWWSWRFLQCLERDWTLSCWSKLLQFSRSESRRVYVSLCVFVCVWCVEWECPFVGRECVCHAACIELIEYPKYVIFIMDYCPSWTFYMWLLSQPIDPCGPLCLSSDLTTNDQPTCTLCTLYTKDSF